MGISVKVTTASTVFVAFASPKPMRDRSGGLSLSLGKAGFTNTGEKIEYRNGAAFLQVWAQSVKGGEVHLPELATDQTIMTVIVKGQATDCYTTNAMYEPKDNIEGYPHTIEKNSAECQARCATVAKCSFFTYFENTGHCHLSSSAASKKLSEDRTLLVTSGPKICGAAPAESQELGDSDDDDDSMMSAQAKIAQSAVPKLVSSKSIMLGESMDKKPCNDDNDQDDDCKKNRHGMYHLLTDECRKECGDVRGLVRQIWRKEKNCGLLDIEAKDTEGSD